MTQTVDREIHDIIEAGQVRRTPSGAVRPVVVLCLMSCGLLWLCFTPVEWAPAAWLALTPLCLLLRVHRLTRRHYVAIAACGWLWAAITLQWMRLGHWAMYFALAALAVYMSLYFPVFVGISRRLMRSGIPMWLTVPLVWTSLDFARAWLLTGFPWYYLGHSQYRWIELIQVCDITGVYGLTFLAAMSSAIVAECLPVTIRLDPDEHPAGRASAKQRWLSAALLVGLVAACVAYGWQRQQPMGNQNGPVIALVQGHFPPSVKHDPQRHLQMVNEHDLLTSRAAQEQPDLIVWPETMWPEPDRIVDPKVSDGELVRLAMEGEPATDDVALRIIDFWRNHNTRDKLVQRAQEAGTSILFGMVTHVTVPGGLERFNSAVFVRPDLGYVGRYDKIHRVVYGEYVPLKDLFPFLAALSPYEGMGIEAGEHPVIFEAGGVRYAPVICFEDTIPRLIRRVVNFESKSGQHPDVLVNLTNDGWFHGSSELDQHLITAAFRCVETRRPMARAVNGGISALIDSSGRIREPETFLVMKSAGGLQGEFEAVGSMIDPKTDRWYRRCSAVIVGQLPLDGRDTIYLRYGDWFAMLCSALVIALWIRSLVAGRAKTAGV